MSDFKKTKRACYFAYLAMSSVFSLPPLLFVTFHEMYGISYTLLGTLVLINFCTQLSIDLIFSFFPKKFNIQKTVTVMPLITSAGMLIYALVPWFFPELAYAGLVVGTVIFSVSAGLCEVLLSPTVASLPSDNPERDMSLLHSLYAYGVLGVVILSTLFLQFVGTQYWMYLTLFWALVPIGSFILFSRTTMPSIDVTQNNTVSSGKRRGMGMLLCVLCLFLGSAAENTMTNWISGYMENVVHVPKAVGDILGMAVFAILLGCGRTLYAKHGKNIYKTLLVGMLGAMLCYAVAGLGIHPVVSMLVCAVTGLFTSMLWPGMLIYMEERFPHAGVTAYALMAAGGDLGASVAPQLMGAITDAVATDPRAVQAAQSLSVSPEQIGMQAGMLVGALFPLAGLLLLFYMKKYFAKHSA